MKYGFILSLTLAMTLNTTGLHAENQTTQRINQFSNTHVNVWKTIVYPTSKQTLAMHRHDYDRVVVALSDGMLKITNDKGQTHLLKLKKDKAYFLNKDPKNEQHMDENISQKPVKVMVIELLPTH